MGINLGNKQKNKKRSLAVQTASTEPVSGPIKWAKLVTAAIVIGCALFLLMPAQPNKQAVDDLSEKKTIRQSTVDLENAASQAAPKTLVTLPKDKREIDTEAEQGKLLAKVEKTVVEFPQDSDAFHIAAITYNELVQTDKAAEFFEKSIAINHRDPKVLVGYAELLLQTGKHQQAIDLLSDPASKEVANAEPMSSLGNAYLQLGELEKALEVLEPASKTFPNDGTILLRLAQTQLQLRQFDEAEKNARKAISLGRADNATFTTLSSALIRLGRRDEALAVRAQETNSNQQETPKEKLYQQSFQQFASHTYLMLASVYLKHSQSSAAQQLLLYSLELEPTAVASLIALADLFYKKGQAENAIAVYSRLLDVQPENIFNYNNLASLALSVGNVPLAEDSLRRAAKADESGNANVRLADFLIRLGKFSEAASEAEIGVRRLGSADAYLVWASALKADGKAAEALNAVLKGRDAVPDDARLKNFQL